MIYAIENLPTNMVGFKAIGNITENDFSKIVIPTVKVLIDKTDKLNYLLVLDTSIKNFSKEAWFENAMMGMKNLTKWNRAAIVSDVTAIKVFTNIFSVLMPGEFKVFEHSQLQDAIDWVSEKT